MNEESAVRKEITKIVSDTLCGPLDGDDEILDTSPRDFYLTGIIYPQTTSIVKSEVLLNGGGEDPDNVPEPGGKENTSDDGNKEEKDELVMTTDFKPSAFGISVMTDMQSEFIVEVSAGRYEEIRTPKKEKELDKLIKEGKIKENKIPSDFKSFKRHPIGPLKFKVEVKNDLIKIYSIEKDSLVDSGSKRIKVEDFEDNLSLNITRRDLTRRNLNKQILTFTLVNDLIVDDKSQLYDATKAFYQPKIKLYSEAPSFSSFDDYTDLSKINDQEELNLKLLYKNYQSFGTGHGAAVDWNEPNEQQKTDQVESQIMPLYEVMGNDFEPDELIERDGNTLIKDCEILYMKRLAGEDYYSSNESSVSKSQLITELKEFSDTYGGWIELQESKIDDSLSKLNVQDDDIQRLKDRAYKNLEICGYLKKRMDQGIDLISSEPLVYQAFSEANKAMFMQRSMSEFIKQRKNNYGDKIFSEMGVDDSLPDFKEDYAFKPKENEFLAKWRPFQLAFLLSQLEGIVDPNSDDRETVDLIWFTTGGGKTEAYLGLIAFVIFYRRLRSKKNNGDPDGGAGVTAIMRYTLRLLNKQQFDRAAPLICACELIRRENTDNYGNKEISLGIWVGSSLTPNKWENFFESFNKSRSNPEAKVDYTIPLYECPCCGTMLMPDAVDGDWGIKGKPHRGGGLNKPAYLHCTNSKCEFYITGSESFDEIKKKSYPIYFVDESIYEERPTLLFATADKFAFINWRNDSYKLFNLIYDNGNPLYKYPPPELIVQDELHLIDSALGTIYGVYEMALDKFCSQDEIKPKIISATATARNAEKQCKLLYGRENFLQFPPSGIDIDDSFFARKIKKTDEEEGRYYVGLQSSGVTNTVAQIRLIGILLQRIPMMEFDNQVIDKYYTALVYFNSLRELGKFRTLIEDDIVAYRNFLSKQFLSLNTGYQEDRTAELSSALDSDQISTALDMLEKAELPKANNNDDARKFYRLGIRRFEDIKSLDNSDAWFKHYYRQGQLKFKGEFYNKFNNKEVFESLGIDFQAGDSLDAIEENEKMFRSKAEEVLGATSRNVAHVASATSMISVGVDIPRLNVMQITGQPKSHSEYIQASSRVGRDKPGVVFTTYNPAKNRDRSHYEKFKDYHQAFYKDVEPTTITPYSLPALEKALPAVIFGLMQALHFGGEVENANWNDDADSKFEEIRDYLINRVEKTINSISDFGTSEVDETKKNINKVCDQIKKYWIGLSNRYPNIRFSEFKDYPMYGDFDPDKITRSVYVQSNKSDDFPGKPSCMTSIRNVESGAEVKIENSTRVK
jgi:hypothetical protein